MLFFEACFHLSLLVSGALAVPRPQRPSGGQCTSDHRAMQVGTNWIQLLSAYTADMAKRVLTEDFTDYSASALSLNNECPQAPVASPPLGEPVFTTREQFMKAQGPQPPIQSDMLDVWHDCSTVTMHWKMTNLGSLPVLAVIVLKTVQAPAGGEYPFLIREAISEFDSSAWVTNLKESGNCESAATSAATSTAMSP